MVHRTAFDRVAVTILGRVLDRRSVDPTVTHSLRSGLAFAVLGLFNIAPTTVAALMAGVGLAIGAARSGQLSNLASRLFMVVLRPLNVGDHGRRHRPRLKDIGVFTTTIDTP
ncbi:MAG: mechanosensitive ion channel family protein [Acidobacteria bacterium]|nr:mechanosensitive ion channel family protein [Acidobacteriota bacterium]